MSNVTDFKLATSALRQLCRIKKCPFIDMPIAFADPTDQLSGGVMQVGENNKNVSQTTYNIIQCYVNHYGQTYGSNLFDDHETQDDFLIYQATRLRRLMYTDEMFEEAKPESASLHTLYQHPLIWLIVKDLICPIFEVPLENVFIIIGCSAEVDIAQLFRKGEIQSDKAPQDQFVYVNDAVENSAVKNALLLIEVIKALELSPKEVICEIFSGSIYTKLSGILNLCYSDEDSVAEFIAVLFEVLDLSPEDFPHIQSIDLRKTAQAGDMPYRNNMQWWYMGLPEKMLETVRGDDWTTYLELQGYMQEFWEDVEKIKEKKKQGEGVNFNDLLRLKQTQSHEEQRNDVTIQGLLSSNRVW